MINPALRDELVRQSKEAISAAVREALRQQLHKMAFAAFEQIMKRLLYKSGYTAVQPSGRSHKRGRTPKGGLDLTARSETELSSSLTICQLKQYKRVVSRRFIDELRGAMLRTGAEQGLLVTTSKFSKVAHQAAKESNVAPIKLIEGEEVLDLLFAYRIGVVERNGVWQLDEKYLDMIQKKAMGTYGESAAAESKKSKKKLPKTGNHTQPPNGRSSPKTSPTSQLHPPNQTHNVSQPTLIKLQPLSGGEMTWSTHLMAGLSTLWVSKALPVGSLEPSQPENLALLAGTAAFGSLLPDLDASESKIKHFAIAGIKPFVLPSQLIYRQLGHRSFLHSLLGLAFMGIICGAVSPLVGWQPALAVWLGYASHLAADASTHSGIPFLYPRRKRFHLLPKGLRITTGSLAEEVIFVLLSLCALAFLLSHLAPF